MNEKIFQTFSPKSFQIDSEEDSITYDHSLKSIILEKEDTQQKRNGDDIDKFYASLSMSFYNQTKQPPEKKPIKSLPINSNASRDVPQLKKQTKSRNTKQGQYRGLTKDHQDFILNDNTNSSYHLRKPLYQNQSTSLVNKLNISVLKSLLNNKERKTVKQINPSPTNSNGSQISVQSVKSKQEPQDRLINLLYSPYQPQKRVSTQKYLPEQTKNVYLNKFGKQLITSGQKNLQTQNWVRTAQDYGLNSYRDIFKDIKSSEIDQYLKDLKRKLKKQ